MILEQVHHQNEVVDIGNVLHHDPDIRSVEEKLSQQLHEE